ncbi:MAG: hypothetical protein ABIQ93_09500, partial [Saprospiraceae bacterium]
FFADVEARQASKGAYAGNLDKVEILLGILEAGAATAEGTAKAKARFRSAAATDKSGLAAYNLAVLNHETLPLPPADPGSKEFYDDESIDGENLTAMLYPEDNKMLPIDESLSFYQHTTLTKNSRLYFNRQAGNISILFQATTTSSPGETARGIKIGSQRTDIEKKYGLAPRSVLTPTGQIMAYPEILFIMKSDVLERWVLVKKF